MTTEDYSDLTPLGDGLFAAVRTATGAACALKVLPGRLDRRTRSEVEAELRRLAPVAERAPVVVADRIVDLPDGRRALRRELLTQSLPELIEAFGPLSVPDAVALGSALAAALDAAGVVHGGVTPGNVLFRASGEPVLTDFGVAVRRAFPADGDPGYRAPETLRDGVLDERTDRYGLGAVLHFALSGEPPFPARLGDADGDHVLRVLSEPPAPIGRDDLPPGLAALVDDLLAKDPDRRPADVAARLAAPVAPPAGTPILEFGPQRRRRRPGPPVLAAAAAVALLAVVAVLLVLSRPADMAMPPPAAAPPSAVSTSAVPSPPIPAVRLELADPVDRGDVVVLTWTSSADLWFGVTVAPEDGRTTTENVQKATSRSIPVDPVKRYCFEIRGTDGRAVYVSAPKAIRGATCTR